MRAPAIIHSAAFNLRGANPIPDGAVRDTWAIAPVPVPDTLPDPVDAVAEGADNADESTLADAFALGSAELDGTVSEMLVRFPAAFPLGSPDALEATIEIAGKEPEAFALEIPTPVGATSVITGNWAVPIIANSLLITTLLTTELDALSARSLDTHLSDKLFL